MAFGNRPIFSKTLEKLTGILTPAHVMHRRPTEQIALNEVGVAQANTAPEHAVSRANRLAYVLMALLGNVSQVHSKTIHVTLAPAMGLCAMATLSAAKGGAKTFSSRHRAHLRSRTVPM